MNLAEYVAKWSASSLTERAAAQQHFLDLCDVLGKPKPADADPTGERYAFEKGVIKSGGGNGFADVWLRGHFAWEYKGKLKNLVNAYQQLLNYREDLENPPLLVVCDLNRFEVHTNFTGTVKNVYAFDLADLLQAKPTETCALPPLDVLRALWEDPERLRPEKTTAQVTEEAAKQFGRIAESLRTRGVEPHQAARFLIRLLFCLFAEDIGLLPPGLFTRVVEQTRAKPEAFSHRLKDLFAQMATGGYFGADEIKHFNGGLFESDEVQELSTGDLAILTKVSREDWGSIEPSILGTLFERGLDPTKRSQLGAHYTSQEDILLIVEPVIMAPLRRRWAEVQAEAGALLERRQSLETKASGSVLTSQQRAQVTSLNQQTGRLLQDFSEEIASVRVLDPACGSGNFLYVALKQLLDLEKAVIMFTAACGLTTFFPRVNPEQMHGIELNEYAHELAPVTVWIGYIQWMRENGFGDPEEPILRRLEMVQQMDAILGTGASGNLTEPEWPDADVVIGNPPFLGDKKMRSELGDAYVADLRRIYGDRVPGGADLVTYWFERSRARIAAGKLKRAGLLATNSIRFGANRQALDRIKGSGDIFMAWSDRAWILDGAAVRVSMVAFDDGTETARELDGVPVPAINADLTASVDVTAALPLAENAGLVFLGMMKAGPFDIDGATARAMLAAPINVNGRPNSDVIKRRLGGQEVTGRPRDVWIIDFGTLTEKEASYYERPFEYVLQHVKPLRDANRDTLLRQNWWLHGRSRPALRAAIAGKSRCIVTPEVAKHRLFAWMPTDTIPDHTMHVIARDDDYFFGVLHSRAHEKWSLAVCNFMGMGNDPRYNSSRTFGTFPFPWPPGKEPAGDPRVEAIATTARELVTLREKWLNPPGAPAAELKTRTLTNLYNERPAWLRNAHRALDKAVFAAYGWPADLADEEILARLLALNLERAG